MGLAIKHSLTFFTLTILLFLHQTELILACSDSPTLAAGERWVSDPGCMVGPTYNDPQNGNEHCHCWSNCEVKKGYICESRLSSTTAKPTTTTRQTTTTAKSTTTTVRTTTISSRCQQIGQPMLSSGETWVSNAGCTNGTTFDTSTQHCSCWSFCGYICRTPPTSTTVASG